MLKGKAVKQKQEPAKQTAGIAVNSTTASPDARAHDGALIPQPHGGAIRPPFAPGDGTSAGAARHGASMRAVRRECREILLGGAEQNMRRMLELCDDPDPRIRVIAIQECNTRLWGRASEVGMADDPTTIANVHDISHLSPAQRGRVRALIAELRGLLAQPAAGKLIDAEQIDNEGDHR